MSLLLQKQPNLHVRSPEVGVGTASQPDTADSYCKFRPAGKAAGQTGPGPLPTVLLPTVGLLRKDGALWKEPRGLLWPLPTSNSSLSLFSSCCTNSCSPYCDPQKFHCGAVNQHSPWVYFHLLPCNTPVLGRTQHQLGEQGWGEVGGGGVLVTDWPQLRHAICIQRFLSSDLLVRGDPRQ